MGCNLVIASTAGCARRLAAVRRRRRSALNAAQAYAAQIRDRHICVRRHERAWTSQLPAVSNSRTIVTFIAEQIREDTVDRGLAERREIDVDV